MRAGGRFVRTQRLTLALLALVFLVAAAALQSGRVVGVVDGDTLTVQAEGGTQVRIRLYGVDAPERGQPFSDEALHGLADLVANKTIRFDRVDTDRYGRTVARVYVGETDVSAELVRQGAAWVFRRYTDDPALIALEREARTQKRGLWALPGAERVPPWEWRKKAKTEKGDSSFVCGKKKYCSQMASCAEARFYLEKCGLKRLDGDSDGTPCASLCR